MHVMVRYCGGSWRREWLPTPVFWPGEFHGQKSLASYSPRSCRVRHDWATFTDCGGWASQVVLVVKNPPASTGDIREMGPITGSRRSSGGGYGNPLQYSWLENPMDRGAWWAIVHRVTDSWKQPSNWAHTQSKSVGCLLAILRIIQVGPSLLPTVYTKLSSMGVSHLRNNSFSFIQSFKDWGPGHILTIISGETLSRTT